MGPGGGARAASWSSTRTGTWLACPLDTASGVRVRKVGPASTIRRILHNVGLVTSEPQTTPLLLLALRGRSAQPVLAVRLRPLGPGRRGRRGDHQLARRPLPLPPRPQRGPRSPAKSPRHPEERQPEPPQTQGKAGRFHQTQKRWLARQPPPANVADLQCQLDAFRKHYNEHRPNRALQRSTPAGPGQQGPAQSRTRWRPSGHYRRRHDHVDGGKVSIRCAGRMHHLGIGTAHHDKALGARPSSSTR